MMRIIAVAVACLACAIAAPLPAGAQNQGEASPRNGPNLRTEAHNVSREELLDRLFGQLHKADDEKSAQLIEKAIWQLWARSGSVTADTLLTQASKAMEAQQYPAAVRVLTTLLDIEPGFSEAWNRRATVYYLMRDFDASRRDIDKVLALEPRHFGALSGLGLIEREQGHKRAALKAFRRALAIHPHLPAARKAVKALQGELEQDI